MTKKKSRRKEKNGKKGRCRVRNIKKSPQTVMDTCGKEKKADEQRKGERGKGEGKDMTR